MREVYLYQTVHVLDGECLCLREHLAVLDRWSRTLFGCPGPQDAREVGTAVAAVVGREAPGSDRSKFVRLVLPASGSLRLEFEGVSLYRGYDLRSLMPEAVTLQYEPPLFDAPTSAREAACMLALQAAVTADNRAAEADIERAAVRTGVQAVIRCDGEGFVHVCDEAPLFAVKGKKVYTPPAPPSVERELAYRAVEAARLPLLELEIGREQLARFDEIFYVDHRGLTSLSACEGQLYAAIITERIARVLNKLY